MKRSNLLVLSALATVTVMGFAACGSKDGKGPVAPTTRARLDSKAGGKDGSGVEIKDQSGAVSVSGEGVFSPDSKDGILDLDPNLSIDDKNFKKIQSLPKDAEADIKAASALRTYINLGCTDETGKKGIPSELGQSLKDMTEVTVTPSNDVTVYTAYAILMCGKVQLPLRMKMSARRIYMLNAYPSTEFKQGKWIISAETILSRGTENTMRIPLKTDGDTALDLNVSTEVRGIKKRSGEASDGGVFQIQIGKKPSTGHSKPNDPKRADDSLELDGPALTTSSSQNSDLKNEIGIEESNGNANENNL